MNFDEWFKDWNSKRTERLQTTHPIMSTVRRKAEECLTRANKDIKIESVFDSNLKKPNFLHRIIYSTSGTSKYFGVLRTALSSGIGYLRKTKEYFASINRAIVSRVDQKYYGLPENTSKDSNIVKEETLDKKLERRMRQNRRVHRLLKIRRFGNFWRNSAGIRTYHIIEGIEDVVIADKVSTFHKLFQIYRPRKIRITLSLFIVFAALNYKLMTDLQMHQYITSLENIEESKKYFVFNKEKDQQYLIVYKIIYDIFAGRINETVDKYPQYEKQIPEINEYIFKNNEYKALLMLPIMFTFFSIFLYQSYLKKKQVKGFVKSLKVITFQFLKYTLTSNIIVNVLSLNSDNYMRFEIAKLLLDKDNQYPLILDEFNFFMQNIKYAIKV
jgi:hypothetical protein